MNKGIVMELSESSIIVMSPNGGFEKIPRGTRNCGIGEEILYAQVKRRMKAPHMAIASALAAAIVMCFVLASTLTGNVPGGQVVAYVTIDINPSVEIGIDNQEVVQDLSGLNTDGENLIRSLEFKGKSLADVTSAILDKAEQNALAKGEGDIVISSTVVEEKAYVNDEAIAAKLKEQVSKHLEQTHPDQIENYEVTAFAAPQEVRQEAKASGVSAGKYAIYLNASNNGTKVSRDDLKSVSIHQLAKDNGGIDKLVKPDKPIDKTTLRTLVEYEKSGKLIEKLQQLQNEKSNNNNDKNSAKPTKTPSTENDNNKNGNKNHNKNTGDKNDNRNDNDKIGKNDRNGRNNGKDDDDDRNGAKKPDQRDDKDDDDSKKTSSGKPSPSVKPTNKPTAFVKPTSKPSIKLSPTPTPGTGSDSDSKGKGNDRDKEDDDKDRQSRDKDRDNDDRRN